MQRPTLQSEPIVTNAERGRGGLSFAWTSPGINGGDAEAEAGSSQASV